MKIFYRTLLLPVAIVGSLLGQATAAPLTFSNTGNLNVARQSHTATLLPSGKVMVAGGSDSNGNSTGSAELYDATTAMWTLTGNLVTARADHTSTLLTSGKVLVSGGIRFTGTLNSAELYDPSTGMWSATGNLGTARQLHTATLLPNGKVLICGGVGAGGPTLGSAELYDPSTGTWAATGDLGTARQGHTATLLPNGTVLVAGGAGSNGAALTSTELYDPTTGHWTGTGNMINPRLLHTATLLANGQVLVSGGLAAGTPLTGAELYDPSTATWTATGSMANARDSHTATLLFNGTVLVCGGYNSNVPLASAELYVPASGQWTATGSLAIARFGHTAIALGNTKVVVSGGADSTYGSTVSTELYDSGAFLTVTNTADSGAGSLRTTIGAAVSDATIAFDPSLDGQTITLTTGELLISTNLTINGPGAAQLTIDAHGNSGVFSIASGNYNVTISGLTITHGTALQGGALHNLSTGTVTLTNFTIYDNGCTSPMGGGGAGIYNGDIGTINLNGCTLDQNTALNGDGGGIFNFSGTINMTNSTLSNCGGSGNGGGIWNRGTVNLMASTIFDCACKQQGGAIYNVFGTVNLVNSTFSGNRVGPNTAIAPAAGGAISNHGTLNATNCTISNNTSTQGGGINSASGGVNIKNCIIAGNNPFESGVTNIGPDIKGNINSQGYNLIGKSDGASISPQTGDQIGTSANPINPLLGPLQDNGGPTQTMALQSTSTAINAGDSNSAPPRDQRGNFRNGNADIGAFEFNGGLVGLSSITRSGPDVAISAEVVIGHTYQLERKMNLTDSTWQLLTISGMSPFIAGANDTESVTDQNALPLGRAFYHILATQ
jgi:hypothetical protein